MPDDLDSQRMERCAEIASRIIANWEATNSFDYTVRATDSVGGLDLKQLRSRTFAVGVGNDLTELPLDDALVIFSLIERHSIAQRHLASSPAGTYSVKTDLPTQFSDAEVVRLLSQLRIETPFDDGEVLRVAMGKPPEQAAG